MPCMVSRMHVLATTYSTCITYQYLVCSKAIWPHIAHKYGNGWYWISISHLFTVTTHPESHPEPTQSLPRVSPNERTTGLPLDCSAMSNHGRWFVNIQKPSQDTACRLVHLMLIQVTRVQSILSLCIGPCRPAVGQVSHSSSSYTAHRQQVVKHWSNRLQMSTVMLLSSDNCLPLSCQHFSHRSEQGKEQKDHPARILKYVCRWQKVWISWLNSVYSKSPC